MCRATRPERIAVTTARPRSSSVATARSAAGAGVGSVTGGTTWSTCRRAPKWRANAAALSPAGRDAREKSVAKRMLRTSVGSVMALSSWPSGLRPFLDDQHRASRVSKDPLRDRAEQEPAHASEPSRADHDEVGVLRRRGGDALIGRIAGRRRPRHAGERALELLGRLFQYVLELATALALELPQHPDQVAAQRPRRRGRIVNRLHDAEQAHLRLAHQRERQEKPEGLE